MHVEALLFRPVVYWCGLPSYGKRDSERILLLTKHERLHVLYGVDDTVQLIHEGDVFRGAVLPHLQPKHEANGSERPRAVGASPAGGRERKYRVHATGPLGSLQPRLRPTVGY